ncbi:MAG: hypothetical protein EA380_01510 [Phycisphaeraceae bacterium]|nr:MAG: hypothetical protein EA380_01510 [Phycisphaeraceae bacterium]
MFVHARRSLAALAACALFTVPSAALAQDESAAEKLKPEDFVFVEMKTNKGDIIIEVDQARAPISAENFLKYVRDGFYEGLVFHRVVPGFVIQGGGFDEKLQLQTPRPPIKNEWTNGLTNVRGSVAMARTNDPDSATSQFYVNLQSNANLDQPMGGGAAYAVFAHVVEGMDVVDKIGAAPQGTKMTPQGPMQNVPTENVVIASAKIIDDEETIEALHKSQESARAARERSIQARKEQLRETIRQEEERAVREAKQREEQFAQAKALLEEKDVNLDGAKTTDSGLWYLVVEKGEGNSPTINDTVVCHYRLWLTNGREVDSSYSRNQPATFPLGGVIRGWQEGVQLLTPGTKAYFIVPPELGYGSSGMRGAIPPNSTLVFEITLLEVQ